LNNPEKPITEILAELNDVRQLYYSLVEMYEADMVNRKQETRNLLESEAKYFNLTDSPATLFYCLVFKPELKFEYVSPSATAITGYTPQDHYDNPQLGFKMVHPDDRVLLENAIKNGNHEPLELRWLIKDGRIVWTEQRHIILQDENGEPYAMEGIARDITEQKIAELQMSKEIERKSLLLNLFAQAPVLTDNELFSQALDIAVKITDSQIGFFHEVSENQLEIILSVWNEEAKKNCTTVSDTHYPIEKAGTWADCIRERKPVVYNDYPTSPNKKGLPDGHAPIARIMSTPVVQNDKVRLIFGVGDKSTDYTAWDVLQAQSIARELHRILEKRDLEKRLKNTETTWHFAIEAINDGIWDWNMLTDEVFFSSRWKEILGFAPHEIAGHLDEWKARVHPDDLPEVMATLEQHLSQEIPTYLTEHRMRCKDGSWKWIMDRGKVLDWTKEGRPARMVGTSREITERKQI